VDAGREETVMQEPSVFQFSAKTSASSPKIPSALANDVAVYPREGVRRTPHISVVIPLYNKADYVVRAVQSVLAQAFADFEILVVNDGSTDESRAVIADVDDPRIRIVDQSNAGEGAARNRGIHEAVGDVVAFCDADDEWMPSFLSTVHRLERSYPECSVFGTGFVMREPNGRERRQLLSGLPGGEWEGVIENYFRAAYGSDGPLFVSAFAARREALLTTGGFPEGVQIGADIVGLARLATRFKVAFSTTPQAVFSLRETYPSRPVRIPDSPDVVGAEFVRMVASKQDSDMRRYVALWHRMRGSIYAYHGQRSRAIPELVSALRYTPTDAKLYILIAIALLPRALREGALSKVGQWRARRRD
jgi:glycosyltransferase involved in cell wall biosynthesis